MSTIHEAARDIPVIRETDICVLGGSCTGVFAAVRAARLGAKVVIVEAHNSFGGVATQGLVNIWHSLSDTEYKRDIIAGLTRETIDRLTKRDAVVEEAKNESAAFFLNTEELKIELDERIVDSGVTPMLHTMFVSAIAAEGKIDAVVVENKSGRGAIRAKYFIDATGDGDVAARLMLPFTLKKHLQPPTMCATILGTGKIPVAQLIEQHRDEFDLKKDWGWRAPSVGLPGVVMHAETHVFDVNCADAADLTHAEIEGRRHVRAFMDIVRKYTDAKPVLAHLASHIGIRETRHISCAYTLTEKDVLTGKKFDDAIAFGSYRVDVHHEDRPGITFRYLDGREDVFEEGKGWTRGRWREVSAVNPTYYQIPYRSLLQDTIPNLIVAGRAIDADTGAYGAVRVMVNMNQTGEAAGVAAYCALSGGTSCDAVDVKDLRSMMERGGSIIL